jgi:hypothetical protein
MVVNTEAANRVRSLCPETDVLGSEPSERGGAGHRTSLIASALHAKFGLDCLPGDAGRLHSQSQGLRLFVMVDVEAEIVHEEGRLYVETESSNT